MASSSGDSVPPVRDVKYVQFGLFSPEETKRMSVTVEGIQYPQSLERGQPKIGGLMDPRQGPMNESSNNCVTCQQTYLDCPGHFGHIDLARPVFHVGFLSKTVNILRCVCFRCSRLKVSQDNSEMKRLLDERTGLPAERFAAVVKLCWNKKKCDECDSIQPSIKLIKGLGVVAKLADQQREVLTAKRVRDLLEKIRDEDCEVLCMNATHARPEWLIVSCLPVPPPCVRPDVVISGKCTQDALTIKLRDIVNANNLVKRAVEAAASEINIAEKMKSLQSKVDILMDSSSCHLPDAVKVKGKAQDSLSTRLKGKKGRLRENLMGKRNNFTARTVITPDPNIRIDEIGVPRTIAQNLTYPEIVSPYNIAALQQLVNRGDKEYPGARYLIRQNGDKIDLKLEQDYLLLEYGDVVVRHISDGDPVVFNRQPTLHRSSMMAHKVRVLPWSTFRLNLSVTAPYNADFDGDEMNLHVPQSLLTRTEVEQIEMTPKQIISPQSNKPVMSIVQDTLWGARKMTRRDVFIDEEQMMELLMFLPSWNGVLPRPAIIKPKPLWTGKQLFSLIIPGKVNLELTSSYHPDGEDGGPYKWISPGDTRVLIRNGELIMGTLCKKTLGATASSLPHVVFMDLGSELCAELYNNIQTVVNEWILDAGLSVGMADTIADAQTSLGIQNIIRQAKDDVHDLHYRATTGQLQVDPGKTLRQTCEDQVSQLLNGARDRIGSFAMESLPEFNNFKSMAVAGSKGSSINIAQVIACVGQQNVEGKRIPFGFRNRTLPHFLKDDHGPESKGFVESSYLQGLNPAEFFFHAMGGREGVIDTAIKTKVTGYMQRRLIKGMEDLMVHYDGTVRNSMGQLIQMKYGEDGLNAEHVEFQTMPSIKLSKQDFQEKYKFGPTDNAQILSRYFNEDVVQELLTGSADEMIGEELKQLIKDQEDLRQIFPTGENKVVLPCNLERMIRNTMEMFNIDHRQRTDLNPLIAIQSIKDLLQRCVAGVDALGTRVNNDASLLFQCLVRSTLSSKRLAEEYRFSSEALSSLIGEIEKRYQQAQVHPGEMVGVIAAQSLGEPATQMTLNTFHFAGASKSVTLGTPRLKEIMNVSKNLKHPAMTVFLPKLVAQDAIRVKMLLNRTEHTSFRDVTIQSAIYYDPDPSITVIAEDQDLVDLFPVDENRKPSPWLLRFELDRKKMVKKKLSMRKVARKVVGGLGEELQCIFSDDNAEKLILRLRFVENNNTEDGANTEDFVSEDIPGDIALQLFEDCLLSKTLLGLKHIKKAYKTKQRTTVLDTGKLEPEWEWVVETDGTSLLSVMSDTEVDCKRTYSNDVWEIFSVLGIEAARKAIEKEVNAVLQSHDLYVNRRHVALLSEVMTAKGEPMPMTCDGINRQETGAFMRSSFEKTSTMMLDAGVHAEVDRLQGVSQSIIFGQQARIGTGCFDLLMDMEHCAKAETFPPSSGSVVMEVPCAKTSADYYCIRRVGDYIFPKLKSNQNAGPVSIEMKQPDAPSIMAHPTILEAMETDEGDDFVVAGCSNEEKKPLPRLAECNAISPDTTMSSQPGSPGLTIDHSPTDPSFFPPPADDPSYYDPAYPSLNLNYSSSSP